MASALKVLADPVRLQIVSLLAGADEACVCELTPTLGVSQPTVSHHLRVLSEAGLVEREQRGRWAYYRLAQTRSGWWRTRSRRAGNPGAHLTRFASRSGRSGGGRALTPEVD